MDERQKAGDFKPTTAQLRVVNDITKKEARRRKLNDFLCHKFNQIDVRKQNNIAVKTACERLRQLPPDTFNVTL